MILCPRAAAILLLIAFVAAIPAGAAERSPESPSAELPPEACVRLLRDARIAGMAGDPARELELLREAADVFPNELWALYSLVEYGRRHPLPAEERQRVLARLHEHLVEPDRLLSTGVVHQIADDPAADDEALRLLAEGVAHRIEGAAAEETAGWLAVLAQIQTRLEQLDAAAATLEHLWRLAPREDVAWSLLRLYRELDRDAEVAALMDSSAELRAALPEVYVHALIAAGRYPEAIERTQEIAGVPEAEAARSRDADADGWEAGARARVTARFLVGVGWRLRDTGRDAEAERMFRRALVLDDECGECRSVLLHLYAGDEERREHAAEAARRREEASPQALLDEGTQRLAAGDAEGALELLERAVPEFPDLESAWFNLGMAAYGAERWSTVDEAFARAAELNPDRAASYYFRGLALVQLDRCAEAVPTLERGLALDADRYQAHYYLAGCYTELGDAEAAARHRALYQEAKPQ